MIDALFLFNTFTLSIAGCLFMPGEFYFNTHSRKGSKIGPRKQFLSMTFAFLDRLGLSFGSSTSLLVLYHY